MKLYFKGHTALHKKITQATSNYIPVNLSDLKESKKTSCGHPYITAKSLIRERKSDYHFNSTCS